MNIDLYLSSLASVLRAEEQIWEKVELIVQHPAITLTPFEEQLSRPMMQTLSILLLIS